MTRIEIPVVVTRVKDEVLGVQTGDEFLEEPRATIYVGYICYILEQPDGTATIGMADGEELTTNLQYTEIKELLPECR